MSDELILDGATHPASNDTLFGHGEAEAFLARSYASGRIHHAVLLEGPPGIGKATLAFRFARHLLLHPDPTAAPPRFGPDPRDAALNRQMASGASHNLLHLTRPVDDKTGRVRSAITVDEVRRAGRFLAQTSGTGDWRIVIVDPADDLNRAAANAILKILEEPPKRSLFLVISHAPGKLLPTIRSRCLSVRLLPLPDADMKAALRHLGLDQGLSDEAMASLLRLAQGSVARAIILLRYGGLEVVQAFENMVAANGPGRLEAHRIAESLAGRDQETAFRFFCEHLAGWMALQARQAALAGEIDRAVRIAESEANLREMLATAQTYNLDRRETVLEALSTALSARAA